MADPLALAGLTSVVGLLNFALPERAQHGALYSASINLLDLICVTEAWPLAYLHWEMQLLEDLGFGLDLSCCVVSGTTKDLAYVSPKSGRAVAAHHAGRWKTQLLPLAPCMIGQSVADNGEIAAGLRTTGHFLEKWLAPSLGDRGLPLARQRLVERLFRIARLEQGPSGEADHE
jgi:DNA repair protein RecO (recombination protein O)